MKTTNMNNTNITFETANKKSHIVTTVLSYKYEEITQIFVNSFEYTDAATITNMFDHIVVVKNIVTGDEMVYDSDAFRAWYESKAFDEIVNYRFSKTEEFCYAEKCITLFELYFTCTKQSNVPNQIENPRWLLEVYNASTNEEVACNWYATPGEMLSWANQNVLNWRYTEAGIENHTFYANGIDITRYFYANERKRYTLSVPYVAKDCIHITIDTRHYPSQTNIDKRKFVCSICGKEHFVKEGKFLPHPVRPNKDSSGKYNHCCAACYEKYVGPMYACRAEAGSVWTQIKELEFFGRARDVETCFYHLNTVEMDSIIKKGNFRKNAMAWLTWYEPNNDADKVAIKLRNASIRRRRKAKLKTEKSN